MAGMGLRPFLLLVLLLVPGVGQSVSQPGDNLCYWYNPGDFWYSPDPPACVRHWNEIDLQSGFNDEDGLFFVREFGGTSGPHSWAGGHFYRHTAKWVDDTGFVWGTRAAEEYHCDEGVFWYDSSVGNMNGFQCVESGDSPAMGAAIDIGGYIVLVALLGALALLFWA